MHKEQFEQIIERAENVGNILVPAHEPVTLEDWLDLNFMSYGDIVGNSITRANNRYFMNTYGKLEGVELRTDRIGTKYIAVRLSTLTEQMFEDLESLLEYPCLDDITLGQVENDMELEDWKNWIERDMAGGLTKKFDDHENDIMDADLSTLYSTLKERANIIWEAENGTYGNIDIDKLVAACTLADIEQLKGE